MMTFNPNFATITENNTETTIGAIDITEATPEELASLLNVDGDVDGDVDAEELTDEEKLELLLDPDFGVVSTELTELREEYKAIMGRSEQSADNFNSAVALRLVKENPSPREYVTAAKLVSFPCLRCAGTGAYITGTVNGVPTGPGGICFRCEGKGRQTDSDRKRNFGYDNFAIAKAVRAMMSE